LSLSCTFRKLSIKAAQRTKMLLLRSALPAQVRSEWDRLAQATLIESAWFAQSQTVLLYDAFRGEVTTDAIALAGLALGKRLVLPRTSKSDRKLWLHHYPGSPSALVEGAYGIKEPEATWPMVAEAEIDLVVVPGVAFDRQGNRLGYGGGYYDRLLPALRHANLGVRLVGLAYGFQVVEQLPSDPHDIAMDNVATEQGLLI
jgi:5-formyltetrahydrofolate cyclo-ligase